MSDMEDWEHLYHETMQRARALPDDEVGRFCTLMAAGVIGMMRGAEGEKFTRDYLIAALDDKDWKLVKHSQ